MTKLLSTKIITFLVDTSMIRQMNINSNEFHKSKLRNHPNRWKNNSVTVKYSYNYEYNHTNK